MTPQSYETTPATPHGPREATVQRSLWNTCASGCAKTPGTPASSSLFPILFPIVPSHSFFPQSAPTPPQSHPSENRRFCQKNLRSLTNKKIPLIIDDYTIYACGEQCTSYAPRRVLQPYSPLVPEAHHLGCHCRWIRCTRDERKRASVARFFGSSSSRSG